MSTAGIVAAALFSGAVSTAYAAASLTPLGDLPGGNVYSVAYGVSGDGSVVAGGSRSASGYEPFRWTSSGGMVGLGDLPGGSFESEAFATNADGSVIVGYGSTPLALEAFRWSSGGGMERLWDVLVANGVDPAADGWSHLSFATGISLDGNTIVGTGWRNNTAEAFVAVIPTIVPEASADFNNDGAIDDADLAQWQDDFGQNANSDADNDNDSDGADFLAWQRQLGVGVPTVAASAAVPEPAAGALALLGVSSILLLQRQPTVTLANRFAPRGEISRRTHSERKIS